ncbi:MAG: methyltransferase domain-containing protein [Planctomycetes bacterium]|nr:methyltransferase domain-containing protein [Planctomycetota bacterium]
MLSRRAKAAFYAVCSPAMKLNGWVYRRLRAPRDGTVKVQLGPGRVNYLDGWINVDANMFTGRCDLWSDIQDGLPFRDNTVDAFYSHHVIEHLPDAKLAHHFREMFRCLKPGGVFRVGGPHGENAMRKFAEGDAGWFGDFPDKHDSLGGKLANFIFCRGEHLTLLTFSYLQELATQAGFGALRLCQPIRETHFPQLIDSRVLALEHESTPDMPHTILVEGLKPATPA